MQKICLFSITWLLLAACASHTVIQTVPSSQARVYIEDEFKGYTPYNYSDKKISGAETKIKLTREGFEDYTFTLKRNEKLNLAACIGGIFLFPLFWLYDYEAQHVIEMKDMRDTGTGPVAPPSTAPISTPFDSPAPTPIAPEAPPSLSPTPPTPTPAPTPAPPPASAPGSLPMPPTELK